MRLSWRMLVGFLFALPAAVLKDSSECSALCRIVLSRLGITFDSHVMEKEEDETHS